MENEPYRWWHFWSWRKGFHAGYVAKSNDASEWENIAREANRAAVKAMNRFDSAEGALKRVRTLCNNADIGFMAAGGDFVTLVRDATRHRYEACDGTCTADCGRCKGQQF